MRGKMFRDIYSPSYLFIQESRLFIEDVRIFYISYAVGQRDVVDDNNRAVSIIQILISCVK